MLVGCANASNFEGDQDAITINLSDFTDMPPGEIWVMMADGKVDKYENNSEGYVYGIEFFLNVYAFRPSHYSERYEGAAYVTRCQVKSIKRNYRTKSGETFESAINLTDDLGEADKNGTVPSTVLTVEADWNDIESQKIQQKDSIVVVSKRFDYKYSNLYAPAKIMKVSS